MATKQNEVLASIVEKAKNDPKFFHALVFDPETALKDLKDVDRHIKASIIGQDPQDILRIITGSIAGCGNTCSSSCDNTCGGSCGYTTNIVERLNRYYSRFSGGLQYCGNTCSSSCDNTCGQSCGYTTNIVDIPRGGEVVF